MLFISTFIFILILSLLQYLFVRMNAFKLLAYIRIQLFCVTLDRSLYECTVFQKIQKKTFVQTLTGVISVDFIRTLETTAEESSSIMCP